MSESRPESVRDVTEMNRRQWLSWTTLGLAAGMVGGVPNLLQAESLNDVFGPVPNDRRLQKLLDYDGYFPWTPYRSVAEWEQRAKQLRRQLLVACGLWPMPARPPIQATIHGRVDREEYTVDRVFFESAPGLYVTGSLYRPTAKATGKRAAVICPHGHWQNGRFHDHGEEKIKTELSGGAEQFAKGGRHPLQARCVQLARMGCVVFLYDMLGYADNVSLSFPLIHQFGKQRPELSQPDHWGLFSAQSELRLINPVGLQTWNSIRVLDWITTLPEVDAERIGVTGASGGGTQTFLLGCVDERPRAFFPAVMVSTEMQGGCTCENASYLRVNTGNIELAALIAPRPLAMSGADDWTREIETKGLPELKEHYRLLGAPDNVDGKYFPYEHNYNQLSRMMMYRFFNKHLRLGVAEPIVERDYEPLTREQATVWSDKYPAPVSGTEGELKAVRSWDDASRKQIQSLIPRKMDDLPAYLNVVKGAWEVMIGRTPPAANEVRAARSVTLARETYDLHHLNAQQLQFGESVPTVVLQPKNWDGRAVMILTETGKRGLFDPHGKSLPHVERWLARHIAVIGVDVLFQGDFRPDGTPLTEAPKVPNPREYVGYTAGYNHPLFAQRVHDVWTACAAVRQEFRPRSVTVIGTGVASLWGAAAFGLSDNLFQGGAFHTQGYRFATITEARDPQLLPGAVKYGDVPALLALSGGNKPLWLGGETPFNPAGDSPLVIALDSSPRNRIKVSNATVEAAHAEIFSWVTHAPA